MAYTKNPTFSTHNTVRVPVSGEPFLVSNYALATIPNGCRFADCFPIKEEMFNGNPKASVQRRESYTKAAASSGTVVASGTLGKDMVVAPDLVNYKNVFFTKNSNYYMFNYSTFAVTSPTTSTVAASAQYAAGTDAIDSTNSRRICWLDASSELKTFLQDGTSVTTTDLSLRGVVGNKGLVYIDGYLFAADSTGTRIYNSTAGGILTTWASTDWLDAEQFGDPVMYIQKHKNYLVAFGTASIEFFYNGGVEVGSPLTRQESYAKQIGLYTTNTGAGRYTARIEDDLYFLGNTGSDSIGLYRIRNFQVELIDNSYLQDALNRTLSNPHVGFLDGVETMIINNTPMIMINFVNENYNIMYNPKDNTWWLMRFGADGLVDFPTSTLRFGRQFYSQSIGVPMFLGQTSVITSTLYYYIPDFNHTQSLDCQVWSPIIDFDSNRTKHFARVDAIGDFGQNNVLTLKYMPTPTYDGNTVTVSPTRSPGLNDNPIAWFNLGSFRRPALGLFISGRDHWVLEGYEIEYNIGMD